MPSLAHAFNLYFQQDSGKIQNFDWKRFNRQSSPEPGQSLEDEADRKVVLSFRTPYSKALVAKLLIDRRVSRVIKQAFLRKVLQSDWYRSEPTGVAFLQELMNQWFLFHPEHRLEVTYLIGFLQANHLWFGLFSATTLDAGYHFLHQCVENTNQGGGDILATLAHSYPGYALFAMSTVYPVSIHEWQPACIPIEFAVKNGDVPAFINLSRLNAQWLQPQYFDRVMRLIVDRVSQPAQKGMLWCIRNTYPELLSVWMQRCEQSLRNKFPADLIASYMAMQQAVPCYALRGPLQGYVMPAQFVLSPVQFMMPQQPGFPQPQAIPERVQQGFPPQGARQSYIAGLDAPNEGALCSPSSIDDAQVAASVDSPWGHGVGHGAPSSSGVSFNGDTPMQHLGNGVLGGLPSDFSGGGGFSARPS